MIAAEGWRPILVAALANLGFKAAVAGLLGGQRLLCWIAILFSAPVVAGVVVLWLW